MSIAFLKKLGVALVGLILVLIGLALLVLPGPGIVIILAGLAVWGTEFHWARRLLAPIQKWLKRFLKRERPGSDPDRPPQP
jgi:uncharacterized protein (TIGR02611 family)